MIDLKKMVEEARIKIVGDLSKEPPIPCKGHWNYSIEGDDYDCDYEHAGEFGCEDCIINGGDYDPRTGKRFRRRKR